MAGLRADRGHRPEPYQFSRPQDLCTQPMNFPQGFELIKGVIAEPHQFAIEEDLMTPTFKLKRPQLQRKYQEEIDAL